jgi:nitrogen fixation protein FixH
MKRFRMFPGIIFVLLGMNMAIVGYTVYAANSDGGAAIEPDYYRKALAHDTIREQERHDAALGWGYRVSVQPDPASGTSALNIVILDGKGGPITGATVHAVAFPSIRANERSQLLLKERAPGEYAALLDISHPGAWRIELTILCRGSTVNHRTDIHMVEGP